MKPIFYDGSAGVTTILVSAKGSDRGSVRVRRQLGVIIGLVDVMVTEVFERLSVERICAALRGHTDDTTGSSAELSWSLVKGDLEFLNRTFGNVVARVAGAGDHVLQPVDQIVGCR